MYKIEKLNYSYQDLEPYIDTKTLAIHYHKHYKNYLNNLNKLLNKNNYNYNYTEEELLFHINEFNEEDREDILFNLGGVLNHKLYFKCLNQGFVRPSDKLLTAIEEKYTSFEKFIDNLFNMALSIKGSGYTTLVIDSYNNLDIINTTNQESPILYGFMPLFTIDLWEHAYYINYQNDKEKYLNNIKNIFDFSYANKIYENIE